MKSFSYERLRLDLASQKLDGHSEQPEAADKLYGGVAASSAIPLPSSYPASSSAEAPQILWSPSLNNLLEQPPATFPNRLILGSMIFSLAFGTWAWFGTIEDVGRAQGKIVPKGETYKIEPIELGKVSQIAVKEGDSVKAGQVLVEFDQELEEQEILRLQQALINTQLELSQKRGIRDRIELQAQTQTAIARSEILAQQAVIALTKEKSATTRQMLMQQQAEASAYRNRQIRLQPIATTAQERLQQLRTEVAAHQQRIERLKPLEEEGAVSQEFLFQAEQQMRETQKQITQTYLQEIPNTREQLFQADQSLRDLNMRTTQNQGDLSTSLKESERLQAELTQKQAEAQRIQLEAQQQMQQVDVEIAQLGAKIADTQNLLASTQAKLKYKVLKAPVDGVVLSLNLKNTGEVAQAGQTIAEIAPHGVPLVLSAVLPNQEAGFVKQGMPVQIKLDAYPYQDYGVVPGKVTNISADTKPDKNLGAVYRVEVELEREYITDKRQRVEFKPGQTATADIIIRHRRIADVLLDPVKKLEQDGLDF